MRILVGTRNQTKIQAVVLALSQSEKFKDAEVSGIEIHHDEFGHPATLLATIEGAKDRALKAFIDCDYSIGIEGGLMEVPETKSGYMQVEACVIYDGVNFHMGLSPAYEWPKVVLDMIMNQGLDGSQALKQAGLTDQEKIGTAGGGISILTNGGMDRTEYNRLSVVMALVHLENPEHY